MKVKIISGYSYVNLEEEINKFIEDVQVIGMNFQIMSNDKRYVAMIMYKEKIEYPPCPPIEIDLD